MNRFLPFFLLTAAGVSIASPRVESDAALQLYDGTQVTSRLVVGERLSETERLAVERLRKVARETFGFDLPVVRAGSKLPLEGSIVLGTPDTNPIVAQSGSA